MMVGIVTRSGCANLEITASNTGPLNGVKKKATTGSNGGSKSRASMHIDSGTTLCRFIAVQVRILRSA